MKKVMFVAIVMILATLPVGAASLSVNTTAALQGTYGCEVAHDGDTSLAYLVDQTPNNETVYRATFYISNTAAFDFLYSLPQPLAANRPLAHHQLFLMQDLDWGPGYDRTHTTVHIKKADLGVLGIRHVIWMKTYDPTNTYALSDGWVYRDEGGLAMEVGLPVQGSAGYPVQVFVAYQTESAANADDGKFCIYRANNFDPSVWLGRCNDGLSNFGHDVDLVALGVINGADAQTTGSTYYDTFESYRTLVLP